MANYQHVVPARTATRDKPLASIEAAHLQRIRKLAVWLDAAYRIPGTNYRIGWDTLIGLIPGAGDAASGIAAAAIVAYGMRLGVRKRTIARMLANVGLDLTVGSIPLLGDIFDTTFKANLRNVSLIEKELAQRSTKKA